MRSILILTFSTVANGAMAHPGHLIEVAGHDHWAIGAAIGAIAVAGLIGALKGKNKEPEVDDSEAEGEPA